MLKTLAWTIDTLNHAGVFTLRGAYVLCVAAILLLALAGCFAKAMGWSEASYEQMLFECLGLVVFVTLMSAIVGGVIKLASLASDMQDETGRHNESKD